VLYVEQNAIQLIFTSLSVQATIQSVRTAVVII